jgi:hypothetical protein
MAFVDAEPPFKRRSGRLGLEFLIVRCSNFQSAGSDGWSRNHDGKPAKAPQHPIDPDQPLSPE